MTLAVSGLSAWYGPAQVLFDLSLEIGRGEVVALLGRNGAGKTATLRSLVGLVDRKAGQVLFDGRDITHAPTHAIVRAGIGFVPEDRRIFTDLTVEENLEVGRRRAGEGRFSWTASRLFELFPNLGRMRGRRGGQMSGGEQQMLAIARTLMGNPSLVLLDDPSEGLAPGIVDRLALAVREITGTGASLLISEQNLRFARAVSERVAVIERGRIRFVGSFPELDRTPEVTAAYLAV